MLFNGSLDYFFGGNHHAKIDNFIIVARQDDPNDIFSNIVNISFYRGHKNFSCSLLFPVFFRFDIGKQIGNGFLHHPSGFYHLRKEHFTCPKKIANHIHSIHQVPFDNFNRSTYFLSGSLYIFFDKLINSFYQSMRDSRLQIFVSPLFYGYFFVFSVLHYTFCIVQQSFCSVISTVQKNILHIG